MNIEEFYEQDSKKQLEWLQNDMLITANKDIAKECFDKMIEWRYRIGRVIDKINYEKNFLFIASEEAKKIKKMMDEAISEGYDSLRVDSFMIPTEVEPEIKQMGYKLEFEPETITYLVSIKRK